MIRRELAAISFLVLLMLFSGACTTIDKADLVDQPPPVPPTAAAVETATPQPAGAPLDAASIALGTRLPVDPAMRVGELPNG
ncbi:MAG: hypothetical protein AAFX50_21485, partial [Acidobacteriota bacterium]